jgi:hypothetical protein
LVGSKNGSFGVGVNGNYVYSPDYATFAAMIDANYRYVFSACERRSFDLTNNGNWSRYLLVATEIQPLDSLPGINFFTRSARVTPGSTFQLWAALHVQKSSWNAEVGYNLWVRSKEKACLISCNGPIKCNGKSIGIFDIANCCNPPGTSASTATICQGTSGTNATTSDTTFTPVDYCDLNLCSAENPLTFSNKIYISIGYDSDIQDHACYIGLNGSYEWAHNASALDQWAVWGNIGLKF